MPGKKKRAPFSYEYRTTPDFELSTVGEFVQWMEGRRDRLSPIARTHLGMERWDYQLANKTIPTQQQFVFLCNRLRELVHLSPLKLWHAIEHGTLVDLLGDGFQWVQAPRQWNQLAFA